MDDSDLSAASDTAQSTAGAKFDSEIKKGSSIPDAAKTAIKAGAAAAATTACAATGVGAVVAPLCGIVGGWLGGAISNVVGAIGHFFSDLFGPSEEYKRHVHDIHINENDVKPDPNHVGTLYSQLRVVDYLLMKQLADTMTTLGQAVQNFDMVPDGDRILDWLSKNVQLTFISSVAHTVTSGWIWVSAVPGQEDKYPAYKWDFNWRAPSYVDKATAILQQWGSGAITNKTAADLVNQLIADSQTWSQSLATQAAKYLVVVATDITVREGLTTSAGRYAQHAPEPNKADVALMNKLRAEGLSAPRSFRAGYFTRFGVVDSVQFLRGV